MIRSSQMIDHVHESGNSLLSIVEQVAFQIFQLRDSKQSLNDLMTFRWYIVFFCSQKLIKLDNFHDSREIKHLFHESRQKFHSQFTGIVFLHSRITAIKNHYSRVTGKPLSAGPSLYWYFMLNGGFVFVLKFRSCQLIFERLRFSVQHYWDLGKIKLSCGWFWIL